MMYYSSASSISTTLPSLEELITLQEDFQKLNGIMKGLEIHSCIEIISLTFQQNMISYQLSFEDELSRENEIGSGNRSTASALIVSSQQIRGNEEEEEGEEGQKEEISF